MAASPAYTVWVDYRERSPCGYRNIIIWEFFEGYMVDPLHAPGLEPIGKLNARGCYRAWVYLDKDYRIIPNEDRGPLYTHNRKHIMRILEWLAWLDEP